MRMYDIINKKKNGLALSDKEINFFIQGYVKNEIPDYQASALLMAICFQSMSANETAYLTKSMAMSGDMIDLSPIKGIKVDKHSTGGVGDKTSLIVGPVVAANGVKVAKMSGRGLGHTGGTIDKLESIPGFNTSVNIKKFIDIVNQTGICIAGQTGNLAPADKKLYSLRDVTATVDCSPLIASSIMSKKIAAGADCILLDVKCGSGSFLKNEDEAMSLAKTMIEIGIKAGKKCSAVITNMDVPLGRAIGNSLEVIEAINTLQGNGPDDLLKVCTELAAHMLYLADKGDMEYCEKLVLQSIQDQSAFKKFIEMAEAQGGDPSYIKNTSRFKKSDIFYDIVSPADGFISKMDTEKCGAASVVLGAGRATKEDKIDCSAGIIIHKKTGDLVTKSTKIATLFSNDQDRIEAAKEMILQGYLFSDKQPPLNPLILSRYL